MSVAVAVRSRSATLSSVLLQLLPGALLCLLFAAVGILQSRQSATPRSRTAVTVTSAGAVPSLEMINLAIPRTFRDSGSPSRSTVRSGGSSARTAAIRKLNDKFLKDLSLGVAVITPGVAALGL